MDRKYARTWAASGVTAALVAGMLGASAPALAADSTVTNVAELKAAVEALGAGPATVTLADGFTPVAASPTITLPAGVELTLLGEGTDGTTVPKDAGTAQRHLDFAGNGSQTVAIVGLTFEGLNPADPAGQPGGVPGGGVGIRNVDSVTVQQSTFSGIDASSGLALGGVKKLEVSESSFLGNRAAAGAAIELPNGIDATITDTTMHKNWGTQPGFSGGALRPQRGTNLTIERTVFTENGSLTRGGAIAFHQMQGSLTIRDSVFAGNRVPLAATNTTVNDGGAIAVNEMPIEGEQSGKTVITGTTFRDNVAADEGGAMLIQSGRGSSAVIQNSTFFNNRAEGKQSRFDDVSGGGAIEAFGTALTLEHNTFVNNLAHKGTSFTHQRGGAVSATGDTAFLPVQPLTLSHNLFVGNDAVTDDGASAPVSSYRQVSARGGVETIPGEPDTESPLDESPYAPVLTRDDLELRFPDREKHPRDEEEGDFLAFADPDAVHATNVGVDNGTAIDLTVINRLAVLGTDDAAPAANGSGVVAGDARTGRERTPETILFHPADDPYLVGLADDIGDGSSTIDADQRKLPVDVPGDAGAVQQAFIRYDPNGGDWADYSELAFDGERIVQRPDDVAMVWQVGAVGAEMTTEPAPTTAPAGKVFAGWNTQADGGGTAYPAGAITIPAGNLRLYAQWEAETSPVEDGSVVAEYVDEEGAPLRDPITHSWPIGDPYTTEQIAFEGYDLVRIDGAPTGSFGTEPVTVRYHYALQAVVPPVGSGTVVASYVDDAGKALRGPITHTGKYGAPYQTRQLSFSGYTFLRVDGKAKGEFGKTPVQVTYVYEAKPPVTPEPPVTPPTDTKTPPRGGLASTGLDLGWPLAVSGAAALLIAAGVLLYGRRRPGGTEFEG